MSQRQGCFKHFKDTVRGCPDGVRCKFSHDRYALRNTDCKRFLAGVCPLGDALCPMLHDAVKRRRVPCVRYLNQKAGELGCRFGDRCYRSHNDAELRILRPRAARYMPGGAGEGAASVATHQHVNPFFQRGGLLHAFEGLRGNNNHDGGSDAFHGLFHDRFGAHTQTASGPTVTLSDDDEDEDAAERLAAIRDVRRMERAEARLMRGESIDAGGYSSEESSGGGQGRRGGGEGDDEDADGECCICMCSFLTVASANNGKQVITCGHAFHAKCIGEWLAAHDTCPLCREKI